MEDFPSVRDVSIVWRGKKFSLPISPSATLKELGHEMQKLTNVKADTMRFIVPNLPNKAATLLTPFSEEHERLSLQETSITGGKPIRMMGVSENEVEEILQGEKLNLRIAGFDEEEKRLQQRTSRRPHSLPKLPQGPYIFCDFRTLRLPGIELNPPASEALKRMHMLASDPGIIAIMNKHRWRVGIMTEMAPIGYVGISPKCLLGFNKNQGEEISLRLRTDDLKGFRKYESIKRTLLHELAHMVHSEHDENFFALNSLLNKEAASLDWTRSASHTLSGVRRSENYDEEFYVEEGSTISQKLGGNTSDQFTSARVASVAAAYRRIADAPTANSRTSEVHEEPDPDDSESLNEFYRKQYQEPDPDEYFAYQNSFEPDPDDSQGEKTWASGSVLSGSGGVCEPPVTDLDTTQFAPTTYESDPSELDAILKHFVAAESEPLPLEEAKTHSKNSINEPDPDDLEVVNEPDPDEVDTILKHFVEAESEPFPSEEAKTHSKNSINEPDPDDLEDKQNGMDYGLVPSPDEDNSLTSGTTNDQSHLIRGCEKADVGVSQDDGKMEAEPYPVHSLAQPVEDSRMQIDEPNPDDEELRRIQDPVTIAFGRFQKSIEMLRAEVDPAHAIVVLQTLYKIISNVIEHPDETKFRRLRKANPAIQKNVAKYNAAVELLVSIGFNDEPVSDEMGKTEMYLVLKRNDPGLLWLAKSCIETNITR